MTTTRTRPSLAPPVPPGYRPAVHPMLWVAAVSQAAEFAHRTTAGRRTVRTVTARRRWDIPAAYADRRRPDEVVCTGHRCQARST